MTYLSIPFGSTAEAMYVRRLEQLQAENARIREENEALAKNLRGKHATTGATYEHLIQERDRLREELSAAQLDAARYRWLREECGYVQDGSSTSVTICQDDATHEWLVRIGPVGSKHWWHGRSLGAAIDNAMKEVGHE